MKRKNRFRIIRKDDPLISNEEDKRHTYIQKSYHPWRYYSYSSKMKTSFMFKVSKRQISSGLKDQVKSFVLTLFFMINNIRLSSFLGGA